MIGLIGLAVKYTSSTQNLDIPVNFRVGTRRYMAPEILDGSFHHYSFDSYIAADLYALGLVLWEILTRCHLHDLAPADEYQVPYANLVPPDPSDTDMLDVVCTRNERPIVPPRFTEAPCCPAHNRIVSSMGRLVVELWDKEPTVRNTALHIKKTILTAQQQLRELQRNSQCPLTFKIDPERHSNGNGLLSNGNRELVPNGNPAHLYSVTELDSETSSNTDDDEDVENRDLFNGDRKT